MIFPWGFIGNGRNVSICSPVARRGSTADPAAPADKPTNIQNSRAGPTDNISEARPTVRCLLVFASWGHPSPGHIAPYFIANSYHIDDAAHSPASGAAPADWD